jgi:alanine racemase
VKALLSEGCDFFAVSSLNEAVAIRRVCDEENSEADILILGYTDPSCAREIANNRLLQALLSPDYADRLNRAAEESGVSVRCHIAVDTGMNRIGFSAHERDFDQTVSEIERVRCLPALSVEGMFTHPAVADDAESNADARERTELQFRRFDTLRSHLTARGGAPLFCHACNSAASLLFPLHHLDGVRLGIALYGTDPIGDSGLPLTPVMRLESEIAHLHVLPVGERVGYGATFGAENERLIATLPIGYADGVLRAYSGAEVTVVTSNGMRRVPIVGRVCMDQCMIDVTDTDARVGDRVILFGETTEQIELLAKRAGTIPYEVLCLISARVTRVYDV